MRTTRRIALATLLLAVTAASLAAHDLFLRLDRYFVPANSTVDIHVLSGTFSKSEGSVARDRLRALDLRGPQGLVRLDTASWTPRGDSTHLRIQVGAAGTYVVGASLYPKTIRLAAKDFNGYLKSDGLPDVLADRRRGRMLDSAAHERYQKHVKAIFQVGNAQSAGFDEVLGYPAELVPLENPYTLRAGSTLRVRALVDGKAVADQYVLAGGRSAKGRIEARGVRTDADGVARIRLRSAGVWYVKFIHMVPVQNDSVNYESKWATLTFGVR